MGGKRDFFKQPTLSIGQQIGRMSSHHKGFRYSVKRNRVIWTGELQPSPLSRSYTVKLDYPHGGRPRIVILDPKLERGPQGQEIPHTFSDESVCLHLPVDWTAAAFIADTIVPWLSLWLYYYEIWHATGEWLGGGHGQ
jgi:hypothetical protein